MKPVKLELQAFGSFAGTEVIDFEALAPRGLFLVSGDTGTGKTTIFDAMCWALYGTMPLKDAKGVRSHHVPETTRTEVRFTFDCGDERYVVTRNPAQLRPARGRSGFANEPADAHLVRVTDTGTEPLATSTTDTTRACEALIGLDATQFQRVILLPQGEFSRFLLADSRDREALLSRLFGARVFDDILQHLKAELDQLRSSVGDADTRISQTLVHAQSELRKLAGELGVELPGPDQLDRESVGAALEAMAPQLQQLRAQVEQLQAVADAATAAHSHADDAAQRFDQAARLRSELAGLDAQADEMAARAAAAEAAAAARALVEAADAWRTADATATAAATSRAGSLASLAEAFLSLGVDLDVDAATVTSLQSAIQEQRQMVDAQQAALGGLRSARQQHDDVVEQRRLLAQQTAEATERRSSDEQRRNDIDQQLPGLRELAATVPTLTQQLAGLDEQVEARAELDGVLAEQISDIAISEQAKVEHERVLRQFVATQAPRLAATLEEGEPCPVCGSADHPSPADEGSRATVTFDDVDQASRAREAAERTVQQHHAAVAALRSRLGDLADTTAAQLEELRAASSAHLDAARTADRQLRALEDERNDVLSRITEVNEQLAALSGHAQRAEDDLAAAAEALSAADAAALGIEPAQVERARTTLQQIQTLGDGIEAAFRADTEAAAHAAQCAERLERELERSPFDDVDTARDAFLDHDQERALRLAVQQHQEASTRATGALQALAERGIPDERPDVAAAAAAAGEATDAHLGARGRFTTATANQDAVRRTLQDHDKLLADSGESRDRAEVLERVHSVCQSGGPGVDMSLKRWVLTRELDRVTAAANVHLHRMTAQRYTLRRIQERTDGRRTFGLDLEVLDAQTGRPRATSSLSGGEQFQASLSLALGLADVVSHGGNASGKRFEALFVDEGFGSLSTQALDDAIETLHQLHATGRMVGAITHVEAMKQQLHVGIEVRRRDNGSGSTLVVRP